MGVGKKYLDESSLRIAYIGDSDEMLQVSFQMVASPKEVASRLRMTPNGELIDILCIGRSAINISFEDLVAFRLPACFSGVFSRWKAEVSRCLWGRDCFSYFVLYRFHFGEGKGYTTV